MKVKEFLAVVNWGTHKLVFCEYTETGVIYHTDKSYRFFEEYEISSVSIGQTRMFINLKEN